eukprot:13466642-Alexandrium_andersonii.AAC.1
MVRAARAIDLLLARPLALSASGGGSPPPRRPGPLGPSLAPPRLGSGGSLSAWGGRLGVIPPGSRCMANPFAPL